MTDCFAKLSALVVVAGLFGHCSNAGTADGNSATGAGGSALPDTVGTVISKSDTVKVTGLDASGTTDATARTTETIAAEDNGTAADGAQGQPDAAVDDAVQPPDGVASDTAVNEPDNGVDPADGAAGGEDGSTEPDGEWAVPDVVKDVFDNGEDPNKPWYQTPLPDQYAYPDAPDVTPNADISAQSFPPLCTPQTGSVSVTESVGLGGKVDIIVWVDTSGSMTEEAKWISTNLGKFAEFIKDKKIDYHLILIGITQGGVKLCVDPPMGTGLPLCGPADPATFMTVKKPIQSLDGLAKLITYYPDYKNFLRPDAAKNIIAVTDDDSKPMTKDQFTTQWENLQIANGMPKEFTYHGIVSYSNDANPQNPATKCSTGATYSKVHIDLAIQTGGSLFQLCKTDWTPAFDKLANAVAATAKPVCTYNVPAPVKKKWNPQVVKVSHIENGVVVPLAHIAAQSQCAANPTGWFYDNDILPKTVTLCDDQCKKLVGGAIVFNFGCAASAQ